MRNAQTGQKSLTQRSKVLCRAKRTALHQTAIALKSKSGLAAIEFALIAPLLAAIVIGISQVSEIVVGSAHMQSAARASIQYALNGGIDMTTANNVGLAAWQDKPANATLDSSIICTCQGATAVCMQTCSDGTAPYKYVSVTATGTLGGAAYTENKVLTEKARIQ